MGGPDKSGLSFATTFAISGIASCVAETVTFPFDITKTRLQAQGEKITSSPYVPKRGFISTIVGIAKEEGVTKLWSGLPPACLCHLVYSGSRVMFYEVLREKVFKRDADGRFALWKGIICGMSAGALGQFVASPTDLVKVQMQLDGKRIISGQPPKFKGTISAFTMLHKEAGIRGMWRGWVPNCQRAALVQLGDLTTYDAAKQYYMHELEFLDGPLLHAMSSATAGLVAATMGAPADVIKTRYMNQPLSPDGKTGIYYKNTFDCLNQTVKREGFMALYKGWLPTYVRMAPWSLVFFLTFEQLRRGLGLNTF